MDLTNDIPAKGRKARLLKNNAKVIFGEQVFFISEENILTCL